jgi:hypothetical protein
MTGKRITQGPARSVRIDDWLLQRTRCDVCSLRTLWTLDNFEFNRVPFFQGFVSVAYDSGVMDKYIWAFIAPDEAVTFRVIEPFNRALHFPWDETFVSQSIVH